MDLLRNCFRYCIEQQCILAWTRLKRGFNTDMNAHYDRALSYTTLTYGSGLLIDVIFFKLMLHPGMFCTVHQEFKELN